MNVIYNGKKIEIKKELTVNEAFKEEIEKNEYEVVGCLYNNEYRNLETEIEENAKIELIDISNKDGMRVYRRGLVYILSKAFEELYPNAKTEINFQLSNSMLCEVIDTEVNDEMIAYLYIAFHTP